MQDAAAAMAGRDELEAAADGRRRSDAPAWTAVDDALADAALADDALADDALASAARTDPTTFEVLYERHWPSVYRYLRARTTIDDDAADLAATTFERALGGLPAYRPGPAGFRAWLLRIARNAAIDASRRRRPTEPFGSAEEIGATEPGPEARVLEAERSRHVRGLVTALPDAQREAVVLRYAAGLSAREIGAVIGKSEAATQKLLTRALARLKESYREDG